VNCKLVTGRTWNEKSILTAVISEAWDFDFNILGLQLGTRGHQGTPNRTPLSPDVDFNRFVVDLGTPRAPIIE